MQFLLPTHFHLHRLTLSVFVGAEERQRIETGRQKDIKKALEMCIVEEERERSKNHKWDIVVSSSSSLISFLF